VEGGHSLGGSLGVLRIYYLLGVRYMTLTSTCNTPWADSSNADAPKFDVKHGGVTNYGKVRYKIIIFQKIQKQIIVLHKF
jgi:membrane dipeptidase